MFSNNIFVLKFYFASIISMRIREASKHNGSGIVLSGLLFIDPVCFVSE